MNSTRNVKTETRRRSGKVISIRDARARRVQTLKALVRSGRYTPELSQVADALIARGVLSHMQMAETDFAN
ncbi:MAG: flagellar biosynthesis anti-sigma factor FlgM [Myxococcota bacterium]